MIEALETKHFASASGEYLGGFGGIRRTTETQNPREVVTVDPETGEESRSVVYDPPTITVSEEWPPVPAGAVEVPSPPPMPFARWAGGKWTSPAPAAVAAAKLARASEQISARPEIAALINVLAARLSLSPAALTAEVASNLAAAQSSTV